LVFPSSNDTHQHLSSELLALIQIEIDLERILEMQAIILVHGIMGSELKLGTETIWPPSVNEVVNNSYERIAKLRDTHAVATDILYQYKGFSVVPIYAPIIRELDDIVNYQGGSRPNFWFDWRLDLMHSADLLAQTIATACSGPNPADDVTIVAHSMGGLVARLVLESGKYNGANWFKMINRFVAVCVPQVGAPIAAARALGLEGSTTISPADMRLIMNDPNFPAGFQLLPAPPYRKNVLYDGATGLDIYDHSTATKFGLSTKNQDAALKSWSHLTFNKPKGVRYISIAANGLPTENAFYFNNTTYVATASVDGDGTVPYWSSSFGPVDRLYTLKGEHLKVMNTNAFRSVLHEIFNSRMTVQPAPVDKPGVSISLKPEFKPEEMMDVLLIPNARTTRISGTLSIKQATAARDGENLYLISTGVDVPVAYEGPPIGSLSLVLPAPQQPGAYVLTFEGTHGSTDETAGAFFVSRATIAQQPVSPPPKGERSSKPRKPRKAK
jgi:phospholipase A1